MAKTKDNNTSEITIPVNLKLLLRASLEYRPLRLFILRYLKINRIAGFEPYREASVNIHHNELYDADGNLKPDEPESIENKNSK